MSKNEIVNIKEIGVALQKTATALEALDGRVTKIEDETPVSTSISNYLTRKRRGRVIHWLGGKKSKAYKHQYPPNQKEHYKGLANKVFAEMERDFKSYFDIVNYGDLAQKDRNKAEEYIDNWSPSTNTLMEIRSINNQLELFKTGE